MQYTYLLIDLGAVIIPFLFSFHPKLRFDKTWKAFWPACLIAGTSFIIWDILYTDLGVWGFNPDYLSGLYIFNLPIEEVLFFICIPYACVFTYHCFERLIPDYLKNYGSTINRFLIVFLLLIGIMNISKLYTSVTFISTSIFLVLLQYVWKVKYLGRFYFMYAIILIPFFIVKIKTAATLFSKQLSIYDFLNKLVWFGPFAKTFEQNFTNFHQGI